MTNPQYCDEEEVEEKVIAIRGSSIEIEEIVGSAANWCTKGATTCMVSAIHQAINAIGQFTS